MLYLHPILEIVKHIVLSAFCQAFEKINQVFSCVVGELVFIAVGIIIVPCRVFAVFVFEIYLAGGDSIAKHFGKIFFGHINGFGLTIDDIVPIFCVVFVVSLVMEPSVGVSFNFAFSEVRRRSASVIFYAIPKFDRGIFGEVMGEALPIEAAFEA